MGNFQNNEFKNKKYYAVNLTEGRILAIFISFIVIVALLVFGIIYLFSNNKTGKDNNVIVESLEDKNNSDFSYYNELDSQDNAVMDIEKKETEKNEVTVNEGNKKEFDLDLIEKPVKEDTVKLDNSKVLYSSDYTEKNETSNVKKPAAVNEIKKIDNKTNMVKKEPLKKVEKKTFEEKFIVQIGSYANKKTAEDISVFYKMQGYPAYIIEKKDKEKTFYRLRIGPFKEKNKAEENLASIKKSKYGESSFISKVYL